MITEEFTIPEERKNDYLWILQNRIFRIFNVITEYGEENFYISFSGGKDSTVLSALVDMAVPGNKIPRIYADTGIEYKLVRDFVKKKAEADDRFIMIKPSVPIRKMLEMEGYPFKSKKYAQVAGQYQKNGMSDAIRLYLGEELDGRHYTYGGSLCPNVLKYQFQEDWKDIKISDKCCDRLKKDPLHKWQKENNRPYSIIGLMREEGGRRESAKCLAFRKGKLKAFQPMVMLTHEWEQWFIDKYNIELSQLYYPPYNFHRTGCKGCPFGIELQEELEILQKYFPKEREQCEIIWKPVYQEYRRIGYRLKKDEQLSFSDDDFK